MSSSEPALHDAFVVDTFVADDVFGAPRLVAAAVTDAATAWMPAPLTPGASSPPAADAAGDAAFAALLEDFAARPRRAAPPRPASRAEAQHAADTAAERARQAALRAAEAEQAAREQALADAHAEGYAAGRAAAEEELQGAFAGALAALAAAGDALRTHEERWLAHLEENVAALAVAVAQQVVGREVAADPALVVAVARHALAEFPVDEPLTLRAHPDDLLALRAALEDPDAAGVRRELRWTPDARVARGGVLAEGRERIVDGRVDAALERMYRALARHHA
jgi:flagellar biosynthesis/type III secretory pathway protein FliH